MLLARRNWESAEPGVLYWDNITKYNLLDKDSNFSYAGTNPCAEEPLPAGGSCLLGSINLSEFVKNPFESNSRVDYDALEEAVAISVQALNQVLMEGMDLHPLEIQRKSVYDWRQIGLGTFGLGDMLIKLGIHYGSKESLDLIDKVFSSIARIAVETSLQLAKLEGCYPMCNKEALADSSFIQALNLPVDIIEDIRKFGLFNSQLLTCAPTGSTATMFGVSTGVEPNFAFSFNRRTVSLNQEETVYKVDTDIVKQYKEVTGNSELPEYFVASQDIDPFDRIAVQAELQKYIDASISSTINLPESTTVEEVFDIYVEAWKKGLKGVTIWRDNCQRQGILTTDKKVDAPNIEEANIQLDNPHELRRGEIIKAGENCIGLKRTLMTGCGTLHCEAFFDPSSGELREAYLSKGST
jgi:ribonucleoside-diphosphate reductase alpha chain